MLFSSTDKDKTKELSALPASSRQTLPAFAVALRRLASRRVALRLFGLIWFLTWPAFCDNLFSMLWRLLSTNRKTIKLGAQPKKTQIIIKRTLKENVAHSTDL